MFAFILAFIALLLGGYSAWRLMALDKPTKADIETVMKSNGIWCTADGGCVAPGDLNIGTHKLKIGKFDVHNLNSGPNLEFVNRDNPKSVLRINSSDHSSLMVRDATGKDTWIYS